MRNDGQGGFRQWFMTYLVFFWTKNPVCVSVCGRGKGRGRRKKGGELGGRERKNGEGLQSLVFY